MSIGTKKAGRGHRRQRGSLLRPGWARRRAKGEDGPVAFVLAGGGNRGAVQVGMLAELVARGIRADRVYGSSVGAVNAAAYCGEPTPEGMAHLVEVWSNLTGEDVFPQGRVHGLWRFVQHRESVHGNDGLRRVIEDGVRFSLLEEAVIPLEVVATSLTHCEERWLTQGPVVEAVLASAAIPSLLPPVIIDGEHLVDGAVLDNVPLSRAIEQGAKKIYVLLCGPVHFKATVPRRPVESILISLFVSLHARFPRELASLPDDVEVVVFPGGAHHDQETDYRDFSGTLDLIEEGRRTTAAVLDGVVPVALRAQPAQDESHVAQMAHEVAVASVDPRETQAAGVGADPTDGAGAAGGAGETIT